MELRPVSAWTKNPNTPETDKQLFVEHEVELSDGTILRVSAIDPTHAIRLARIAIDKWNAVTTEEPTDQTGKQ